MDEKEIKERFLFKENVRTLFSKQKYARLKSRKTSQL